MLSLLWTWHYWTCRSIDQRKNLGRRCQTLIIEGKCITDINMFHAPPSHTFYGSKQLFYLWSSVLLCCSMHIDIAIHLKLSIALTWIVTIVFWCSSSTLVSSMHIYAHYDPRSVVQHIHVHILRNWSVFGCPTVCVGWSFV